MILFHFIQPFILPHVGVEAAPPVWKCFRVSIVDICFCAPELLVDGVSTADWRLLSRPTHLGPVSVEDAPCQPAALKPERVHAFAL